jgi:hypothetical protein
MQGGFLPSVAKRQEALLFTRILPGFGVDDQAAAPVLPVLSRSQPLPPAVVPD